MNLIRGKGNKILNDKFSHDNVKFKMLYVNLRGSDFKIHLVELNRETFQYPIHYWLQQSPYSFQNLIEVKFM